MGWFSDTWKKLGVIVANPGYAAGVVAHAVSEVASGHSVTPVSIPVSVQTTKATIASVAVSPFALFGGAVAGEVGAGAAALLPAGKLRDEAVKHPFATTAALAAGLVIPATAASLAVRSLTPTGKSPARNPAPVTMATMPKAKAKPRKAKKAKPRAKKHALRRSRRPAHPHRGRAKQRRAPIRSR